MNKAIHEEIMAGAEKKRAGIHKLNECTYRVKGKKAVAFASEGKIMKPVYGLMTVVVGEYDVDATSDEDLAKMLKKLKV